MSHDKKLYHVLDKICAKKVMVEERINGKMLIIHNGKALKHKEITMRPARKEVKKRYTFKIKKIAIPRASHPWKQYRERYPQDPSYPQKEKGTQKEKGLRLTKT